MAIVITEDWRAGRITSSRSASRAFDISGTADWADALDALSTMEGVCEGAAYPIAIGEPLSIDTGGLEVSWNGRMIRVVASYTPGASATALDDPGSKKWDCRMSFQFDGTQTSRDGAGVAITNSLREPIGITFPALDVTIVLQMKRFETGSGLLAKAITYYRKVNSTAVTFPKIGTAAIGEAMLACIEVVDNFTSASAYLGVLYTFHCRARIFGGTNVFNADHSATSSTAGIHGFRRHVPDIGLNAYGSAARTKLPIQFKYPTGAQRTPPSPVPLDAKGCPFDPTAYGIILTPGANVTTAAALPGSAPVPYIKGPDGVTLLYDDSRGLGDLNDLNIAANI